MVDVIVPREMCQHVPSGSGSEMETAMYQIQIYPITRALWRWEIRCMGALLFCGTARTKKAAEYEAKTAL